MKIIPAIDIMDKSVVRLERGEFGKETIYSGNPTMIAEKWKASGADLIHVVDLDGARLGRPINLDVVSEIAKNVKIDIELGGGLRSEEDLKNAFNSGTTYLVVGTSAVEDEVFCGRLIEKYKDKVIFAVDARDGKVATRGWKKVSEYETLAYAKKLEHLGAKKIIYTDISRDGMMTGPNLENLKSLLGSTALEITASGGISGIEDIKVLKGLEKEGLRSVIVGKALYEGKLDLKEAIDAG